MNSNGLPNPSNFEPSVFYPRPARPSWTDENPMTHFVVRWSTKRRCCYIAEHGRLVKWLPEMTK